MFILTRYETISFFWEWRLPPNCELQGPGRGKVEELWLRAQNHQVKVMLAIDTYLAKIKGSHAKHAHLLGIRTQCLLLLPRTWDICTIATEPGNQCHCMKCPVCSIEIVSKQCMSFTARTYHWVVPSGTQ